MARKKMWEEDNEIYVQESDGTVWRVNYGW